MDTTGKRIRNCRPLLYLRLLTQRVSDPLAQICSHNRLIGQFGHSAQPLNSRIKVQKSIEVDDSYATPYALTALWHSIRANQGWSSDLRQDSAAVDRFAAAALERDP